MAQVLHMHAAPELGKTQTQFQDNMDTTADREPPTPASPDSAETRGRRREREDSGEEGPDGPDGDTGGSRKRRRSRKGLDKKFECPHEGCGKSYSRAEHLYRHQLNRMSTAAASTRQPDTLQTTPSKSTTATFQTATGTAWLLTITCSS
jgi:hypothetical protein